MYYVHIVSNYKCVNSKRCHQLVNKRINDVSWKHTNKNIILLSIINALSNTTHSNIGGNFTVTLFQYLCSVSCKEFCIPDTLLIDINHPNIGKLIK